MFDQDHIRAACEKVFAHESRLLAVVLLGSAARNELRPESDIDLGVLCGGDNRLTALELADYAANLSVALGRSADLGLISSANLVYAAEAFYTGVIILDRDNEATALKRANLLGMYLQFNRDRQEVLDAYRIR